LRKLTPKLQGLWDAMLRPSTPEEENRTQIDFIFGVIEELVRLDGVNVGQEHDARLKPLEWHAAYPVRATDSEELWASRELAAAMVEYGHIKRTLDQQMIIGVQPKIAEMLNLGALLGRTTYAAYVAFTKQLRAEDVLLAEGRRGNQKGATSRTRWKIPFSHAYVAFREAYDDLPTTEQERLGIEAAQSFALQLKGESRSDWHGMSVPKDTRSLKKCLEDEALLDNARARRMQTETSSSVAPEDKLARSAREYVANKFKVIRVSDRRWKLMTQRD
jgi:hypothetical protein